MQREKEKVLEGEKVCVREREKKMEVEMEVEPVFDVREVVDFDYEFEAAMYFDLSRAETRAEACEAELWFESAKEYPPSRQYLYLKP